MLPKKVKISGIDYHIVNRYLKRKQALLEFQKSLIDFWVTLKGLIKFNWWQSICDSKIEEHRSNAKLIHEEIEDINNQCPSNR